MDIKAVALDVDKTMTSEIDGQLMESCITACKKLREKGIKVIIATGRQCRCIPFVEDGIFQPDYLVAANGSQLADGHGRIIKSHHLDRQVFEDIKAYCQREQLEVFWKFNDAMYAYPPHSNLAIQMDKLLEHFVLGEHPDEQALPTAAALACNDMEEIERFREVFGQRIGCIDGGYMVHDLDALGCDKGSGLKDILDYLQIDPKQCMAFGDSENDEPMIRLAGCGVAMGNAFDSTKAIADYVTDKASEDGVYKALQKFAIIE